VIFNDEEITDSASSAQSGSSRSKPSQARAASESSKRSWPTRQGDHARQAQVRKAMGRDGARVELSVIRRISSRKREAALIGEMKDAVESVRAVQREVDACGGSSIKTRS
jgi:hypothetical protein